MLERDRGEFGDEFVRILTLIYVTTEAFFVLNHTLLMS